MQGSGYESDSTVYPETDCEEIYESFTVNIGQICEISDMESEHEELEETSTKEKFIIPAIPMTAVVIESKTAAQSPKVEKERKTEEQKIPHERSRRHSGRRKSMSSDRNVAKTQ